MKKNVLLLFVALSFFFNGCFSNKKVLKIGLNAELTGEVPAVGASCVNAAKLFVEHVNQKGGLDVGGVKIPISLVVGDNGAKPDQAATVAQRLISQENILAMVGPNISSCAIPAAEIAESLHCLMFSPWSTNPLTTISNKTKAFKKWVYRGCFTDAVEIPALAQFARGNLNLKRAAILYDISSEYPTSATALFTKAFTQKGGSVVATETYTTGDRDFSAQLTKIKKANPEVLFLPAYYNDGPLIAEQARRLGITAIFLGGNSWSTPEMLKLDSGHYLNGSFLSNHFSTQSDASQVKSFITEYQQKFGQLPDDIAALTYDTMGILSEAIVKAGKADRTAILDAMGMIEHFSGITGNFIYEKESHDPKKSIVILTVKDGAFGYVTTVEP
ncbi:MAG: ABC transporter substrate-binding protein [Verrucomicrobia bacterium]|nr:ABC transporter substrate-binding protein [Verrucomicrobiota bacterium]